MERARGCFRHLKRMFQELEECRAFELLKVQTLHKLGGLGSEGLSSQPKHCHVSHGRRTFGEISRPMSANLGRVGLFVNPEELLLHVLLQVSCVNLRSKGFLAT